MSLCVCPCVFCRPGSKNFCFKYYCGFSSHRRTHCGLFPPASYPSPSHPSMDARKKGTLVPWGSYGRVSTHTSVRARLGVTGETWRWWEGDTHTKHTRIPYADTLKSKGHFPKAGWSFPGCPNSKCFHGRLLFTLISCDGYCKKIWLMLYIPVPLQLSHVKEEPRHKVKSGKHPANVQGDHYGSTPNPSSFQIWMFTESRSRRGKKVNYNSQFSSILKATAAAAGLTDHHTLLPGE